VGTGGATGGTGGAVTGGTGGATGAGGTVVTGNGTFCGVLTLVRNSCQSCHANTPNATGAPMNLITRADLMAPAVTNRNTSVAALAVTRIGGSPSFMPPAPLAHVSAAPLTTWINAGMLDDCNGTTTGSTGAGGTVVVPPPPPDPFAGPSVCTSGTIAVGADGPTMRPGEACLNCHTGGGGGGGDDDDNSGPGGGGGGGDDDDDNGAALYTLAGTVFPTAHEPNDCVSNASPNNSLVTVQVFDAAGRVITMTAGPTGNFSTSQAVTFPITALLTKAGRQRAMTTRQTSGNCNSCHTQNGANGAPGRILAP
jgi:hypothetical protein